MKAVTDALATYLNTEKEMNVCDLYTLTLYDGTAYYYTDADKDIIYNGHTYLHNALLLKREQTKINNVISVDSMTVSIYATADDKLGDKPIFLAAHDGALDRATLALSRCFFDADGNTIGAVDLFSGITEVKSCGGLLMKLTVKSKVQGLSQEFPRRRFYPQGTYSTSGGKVSSSTEEDSASVIAPYVPLKEVLL
ncbi:DUF2163 domain-containing protein [uncultured Dialister sp.]|uniref:baseplate hub domain-containing protein n=1 Tax=uncultured Dialister sp. TaxID=278064 RepID=UPI002599A752|nr:DUF2163 domain-containing protein [uncultured Dialister sp.]